METDIDITPDTPRALIAKELSLDKDKTCEDLIDPHGSLPDNVRILTDESKEVNTVIMEGDGEIHVIQFGETKKTGFIRKS